jgi:tetratricopeptide (TPR) repeat protein
MKTLYDLLGALPDDDAESLRSAFRKAVKANHPDINADDPDAPLRFRQIVRANAILRDAEQRAAYDRLLAFTRRQPGSGLRLRRTIISDSFHKFASDAIAVVFLSVLFIGGYTLFEHFSKASVIPGKVIEVSARGAAEIAPVTPPRQFDAISRDELRVKLEGAGAPAEATVTSSVAPAANAGNAQEVAPAANTDAAQEIANGDPAPDLAANDAKSHRERGMIAYRDGDLYRAIADFNLAIQLDPSSADAYIDRGIVFYRMHEFDRAFADIAQAKRIENSNRTKTPLQAPHKTPPASGKAG